MSDEMSVKDALEKLREDLQVILEGQASISILYKARFDALMKVGFTEEQALELVKARGMNA